jgi:hypothetical protein
LEVLDVSQSAGLMGRPFKLQLDEMQAAMPNLRVLNLTGLGGLYGELCSSSGAPQKRSSCPVHASACLSLSSTPGGVILQKCNAEDVDRTTSVVWWCAAAVQVGKQVCATLQT